MESILALLKHLAVSRIIIVAAFIAATVLYVGPSVAPQYVPTVPDIWKSGIIGVGVFTGVIVAAWLITELVGVIKVGWRRLSMWIKSHTLNKNETQILLAMSDKPREPFNLDNIPYDRIVMSELEFIELINSLQTKGFVSINPYASNLIHLTKQGRAKALELQFDAESV
tara:strand:+ start:32307 stop:32813 length:507 start_codon:yes stop_codon:yes gene_type:complete